MYGMLGVQVIILKGTEDRIDSSWIRYLATFGNDFGILFVWIILMGALMMGDTYVPYTC